MAKPFQNQSCLIYDYGIFFHAAKVLARDFGQVFYYVPWESQFPNSKDAYIGKGYEKEGIERVKYFEDYTDKADLIIFPDVYCSSVAKSLRQAGKRVWAAGESEVLETDRIYLKKLLAKLGLATGKYDVFTGTDALLKHLKQTDDAWVKGGLYRGDFETYHHDNYDQTEIWINNFVQKVGMLRASEAIFLVEAPLKGVEIAMDGSTVDGQFSKYVAWGFEEKGSAYMGKTCEYDALPESIREINTAIAPTLRSMKARTWFSGEIVDVKTPKGIEPHLSDPCMRMGNPPSQAYMEMFANWGEHIWYGAEGRIVDLEPVKKYACQIQMSSDWAIEKFLPVSYPKEESQWIKLRDCTKAPDGQEWIVPNGIGSIGAVVAIGNSLADTTDLCLERAKMIKGLQVDFEEVGLEKVMDHIEEGRKLGIKF